MADEPQTASDGEQDSTEPRPLPLHKRAWRELPQITAASALTAAGFFFIGWQYKQSLALKFGLASYPGDTSFQSTVATGVSIFDSYETLVLIVPFIFAFLLIRLAYFLPDLFRKWVSWSRSRADICLDEVNTLSEEADKDQSLITNPIFWGKVKKAQRKAKLYSIENKIMSVSVDMLTGSIVLTFVLSVIMIWIGVILLFYIGNRVAESDAREIRIAARGRCEGCFLYETAPEVYLGVAVFQSPDVIYIQEYDGLVSVERPALQSIVPFRRAAQKPLTSPRR